MQEDKRSRLNKLYEKWVDFFPVFYFVFLSIVLLAYMMSYINHLSVILAFKIYKILVLKFPCNVLFFLLSLMA